MDPKLIDAIAIEALVWVNAISLFLFLILLGATLASMGRRVWRYRQAEKALPVILKRGIVLFGALAVLGGEAAVLRVLGVDLVEMPLLRLIYVTQADLVLLGALGYFAKTDLFDIDDPDVK